MSYRCVGLIAAAWLAVKLLAAVVDRVTVELRLPDVWSDIDWDLEWELADQ